MHCFENKYSYSSMLHHGSMLIVLGPGIHIPALYTIWFYAYYFGQVLKFYGIRTARFYSHILVRYSYSMLPLCTACFMLTVPEPWSPESAMVNQGRKAIV